MSTLTIPNSIEAGQPRNASPLKENFDAVATWANGNVGTTNLTDSAVTTVKIAAANVTKEKLGTNVTTQTWHEIGADGEPAFENSWANNASYESVAYCKDAMGFVHLRGLPSGGTNNTVAFTLPSGYRPPGLSMYIGSSGANSCGRVSIQPTGTVAVERGSSAYVSLSGITFYVG